MPQSWQGQLGPEQEGGGGGGGGGAPPSQGATAPFYAFKHRRVHSKTCISTIFGQLPDKHVLSYPLQTLYESVHANESDAQLVLIAPTTTIVFP